MAIEMTTKAAVAPQVAVILQELLQQDDVGLAAFLALAQQYMGRQAGSPRLRHSLVFVLNQDVPLGID